MKTLALLLIIQATLENVTMFDTSQPWNLSLYQDIFNSSSSSVDKEDDLVSCEGNCGRSSKTRCSCDETCSIFTKCCKDYIINCEQRHHKSTVSNLEMQNFSIAPVLNMSHNSLMLNNASEKHQMSSFFDKDMQSQFSAFNESAEDNAMVLLKKAYKNISAVVNQAYDKSIDTNIQYKKYRTSLKDKGRDQSKQEMPHQYIYPQIQCTEDRLIIISSCYNDPEIYNYETNDHETDIATNSYRGVRLLRSPSTRDFVFESSDESNMFLVTDLSTGYTFSNWSIFTCFEQRYSKPFFWRAFVKKLSIQHTQSYMYVTVEFKNIYFEIPKDETIKCTLRRCELCSGKILEKADFSPECKVFRNSFSVYREYLNYSITVKPFKRYPTFISSDIYNPWSELQCQIQLEKGTQRTPSFLNCTITKYRSNFFEQTSGKEPIPYVVKLVIAARFFRTHNLELFSQMFICLLHHYANINVLRTWSPTILTFLKANKADYFLIKILIRDNLIFQNNNQSEIRENLNKIFNMIFVLYRNEKLFTDVKSRNVDRTEDLPELWSYVDFHYLNFVNSTEDVVCGCSVTLEELSTFKYLEEWLCELQCEMFEFDQENIRTDFNDIERKCLVVNKSPKTYDDNGLAFFIFVFLCYFLSFLK